MARKASSLSCRSSLTRTKKTSLPGTGPPLLNESGLDTVATTWDDSVVSDVAESFDQEECGMKSLGTTCSMESSFVRPTPKAWSCFAVGPVLRVLLNSLARSFDAPSSGTEIFEGMQQGKSRGVAGGGGSRGPFLSWRVAGAKLVSDSHICCMSSR